MTDQTDNQDAAYEADLATGDADMWNWVNAVQAEAGARTIDDYVRSLKTERADGHIAVITPLADMSDELLFARAKELTAQHRAVQTEMSRRRKAAAPPAFAQCGHAAQDAQGVYCDEQTCPRYVPF